MSDREDLVAAYVASRSSYVAVVDAVSAEVREGFRAAQIDPVVSGREKDPWSLATKLLTKDRAGTPYSSLEDIPDLAGVRVVAKHIQEFESAKQVIQTLYPLAEQDDKSASLGPDTFRYRGIHFQIYPDFASIELRGMSCEVQLRTGAEHLWSDLSHELFYKTPGSVSRALLRRFHRLVAIVELFDLEVDGTMKELSSDPSSRGRQILATLESHFAQTMPKPVGINRELSLALIESMSDVALMDADVPDFSTKLSDFVSAYRLKLQTIYTRVVDHPRRNPFVIQPESLLIWFLIENRRHDLLDKWLEHEWDEELLQEMGNEWGVVIDG